MDLCANKKALPNPDPLTALMNTEQNNSRQAADNAHDKGPTGATLGTGLVPTAS